MSDFINSRYESSEYLDANPSWDIEDSPWKAKKVAELIFKHKITPSSICEIGCGAGGVLAALRADYPNQKLTGYDIAPTAKKFWSQFNDKNIDFNVGDFFELNDTRHNIILLLDVLEHIADPHQFLLGIKPHTDYVIIHFPLDLSASSVLRESPLLYARRKVGHIHYFTKGLALELLKECSFEIIDYQYTGAALTMPQRNFQTKLLNWLRRPFYLINKDIGVRLLGGETLMVLAKPLMDRDA
jgi:hypothetical protein